MSEMSNEAIQAQIEANRLEAAVVKLGDAITDTNSDAILYVDSSGAIRETGVTASKPVYIDSSSVPQTGAIPFPLEVTAANDTTFTFLDLTGRSSISTDELLTGTFVQGAQVTTFTKAGFLQVNITDNGGNITDGIYYIQVGLIS